MNIPIETQRPQTTVDIGSVRAQIDCLDRELAVLITQRCSLSATVAAAKRAMGDGAFGWRPSREVEILRTVMQQQASLDPELAFCVWRALISANLTAQGDLKIITVAACEHAARAAFSVGVTPHLLANLTDVLRMVVDDDHAIGIAPWPTKDDWWVTMMEPEFSTLHVCAASPLAGDDPEVLLIAARPPEMAGDDISLIAGPLSVIDGGIIAQSGSLALVACGDFIAAGTKLPPHCRLIGSFALA